MIHRKTQTEEFWQHEYRVTDQDLGLVYGLILDAGRPVPIAVLTKAILEAYSRREEASIQAELSRGELYQPKDSFEMGQRVVFPAMNFALGTIVGSRPARNPEHGDFVAVQVQFEDEDAPLEFASELTGTHRLNFSDGGVELLAQEQLQTPDELYEAHGAAVEEQLREELRTRGEYTELGDAWFLTELLVDVGLGQLNIAEALIEIKSMPLPTTDLLPDLDLPAEVPEEVRILSLNRALEADRRFDNVGDSGRDIWYLRRLTPEPVANPPSRLQVVEEIYDRRVISRELLLIEREIEDEEPGSAAAAARPIFRTTFAVPYSFWRQGVLPLTMRTRGLFPTATTHHSPIVLVDGQGGDKMQGWVVHGAGFVYGLGKWFRKHGLPAGALLRLERTRDPRVITVDFEPERLKRLWVPTAVVRDGTVQFQLRKTPVACAFDENLLMGEDKPEATDSVWEATRSRGTGLLEIMTQIMPELAKLSPEGTVHAKLIYSAVNVVRRTAPGPIFALLSSMDCFVPVEAGFWAFREALVPPLSK